MKENKVYRMELSLSGKTISEYDRLSLEQSFVGHHRAEIHLPAFVLVGGGATDYVNLKELTSKYVGEKASLHLKEGTSENNSFREESRFVFEGIVAGIQLQKVDMVNTLLAVTLLSPTILLDTGEVTQSFTEKTLDAVVKEVIKPSGSGLPAAVAPEFKGTIPYLTQYQETSLHFLQRLADTYGEWCFYNGTRFVFGKSAASSTLAELEYGSNLNHLEYQLQLAPATAKGSYYDYLTDKLYQAPSAGESVSDLQEFARAALSKSDAFFSIETRNISFQGHQEMGTMKRAIKMEKSVASNQLASCKGLSNSLQLKLGGLVKIKDEVFENGNKLRTDDYGTFLITELRHFMDARGVYQNSFEAIPQDTTYPPVKYLIISPKAESQPAKVKEVGDEKNMGRVKVQFYWQPDGQKTPWIRVASLMSGDKQGVYFTPEINDVVFVDFEFGNPDLPFVRGAMYHGATLPGQKLFHKENNFKGIITRGGNHLLIDDSSGKEEIRIFNKDTKNEVRLSLSGETMISIKSEGKIRLEGKEVEIKAQKITMKADQDWNVEANQASVQVQSTLHMEGTQVNLEAKSKASVKAGGQLDLEGSTMASLKGGIVKIN